MHLVPRPGVLVGSEVLRPKVCGDGPVLGAAGGGHPPAGAAALVPHGDGDGVRGPGGQAGRRRAGHAGADHWQNLNRAVCR